MKHPRNKPCWCGSGKKYKHCHHRRERQLPLPPARFLNELRSGFAHHLCLHPDAGPDTCGAVIKAHTVQRSRVLRAITDDRNHVLTFDARHRRTTGGRGPFSAGWRDASTMTGFCSTHDSATFRPLEGKAFDGSVRQCFLHAYRAVCHLVFSRIGALQASSILQANADKGLLENDQQSIQTRLGWMREGLLVGSEDLRRTKELLDDALKRADYCAVESAVFELSGDLCIAASGGFSPHTDLQGNELQVLHALEKPVEVMTMSSDITDNGCALTMCWPSVYEAPRRFVDCLMGLNETRIVAALPQLLFLHIENTFFSSRWWATLPPKVQALVSQQAWALNPCDSQYVQLGLSLAGWKLIRVRRNV